MQLETYRRILFLDLQPAILEKMPMVKIKLLLSELEPVQYQYQPLFEVEHERFLNARHEYYESLLNNESTSFLNEFRREMSLAQTDSEKKYLISRSLKQLEALLLDCFMWSVRPNNSISESIVKPAVKHHLIRLLLEVSADNNVDINELFIDEVYERYLFEHAPNPPLIHTSSIVVVTKDPKRKVVSSGTDFQVRYEDFRQEKKGILSYDTIIKNQKRFAEFEEHLFLYGFIDSNYNFTNKHGMKTELAKKYHELINDACFMPRDFKLLKDIQARDIRKFLDHRYHVNLDKQFRVRKS